MAISSLFIRLFPRLGLIVVRPEGEENHLGELCKKEKIKPNVYCQGTKYAETNLKKSTQLFLVSIRFGFRSLDRVIFSRRMRVGFMTTGRNRQAEKQYPPDDGKYFFIHWPGSRGRVDEPFQVALGSG